MPLTEHIAVALAVVGSGAGAEEVPLVVAGHLGSTDICFGQQRGAGLPGTEVVLGHFAQRVIGIGNAGERRVDVAASSAITEDRLRCQESAGRNANAFVFYGCRAGFFGLLGGGLLRGHGGLEDFVASLQVADRGVEGNGGGLHFGGGIDRFGCLGAGFRCASVGGRRGFARFVNLAVALGELLLQHLKLFLLGLQSLAKLFQLCRDGCIGALSLLSRFGLRRLSPFGRLRVGVFRSIGKSSSGNEEHR